MDNGRSCSRRLTRFFEYDTPQMLNTNSKLVGVMFRLLQLVIITFVLAYYIGYRRGYQEESNAIVSTVRLTPRASANATLESFNLPQSLSFGQVDTVLIPTYAVTLWQFKSTCVEDIEVDDAECNPDDNRCVAGRVLPNGNGRMTGRCISSGGTVISSSQYSKRLYYGCEIDGWCASYRNITIVADEMNLKDMALVVQTDIYFPKFENEGTRNNYNNTLMYCLKNKYYHSKQHPNCPIFRMGDILSDMDSFKGIAYQNIMEMGAVISVEVGWTCDFDLKLPNQCSYRYIFKRMDTPVQQFDKTPELKFTTIVGNSRSVVLINAIRFISRVEGTARKFDLFVLLTRIGASVGLFAIAAVVCEVLILFSCCTRENHVRDFKYLNMKSIRKNSQVNNLM